MIRELNESELPDLLRLYEHLHVSNDPLPPRQVIHDTWQSIRANPSLKYFGAFVDGALVSSCALSIVPNLTRGCRPYGLIENVVTAPPYRRRGHGRAVLQHALEYAWSRDCYKVMLLTGSKREEVYRFYESAGFDRHAKKAFVARSPQLQLRP